MEGGLSAVTPDVVGVAHGSCDELRFLVDC